MASGSIQIEEEMQRLFVAAPIPDHIKEELLRLKINIPGARWVDNDQLHITLKFIGEVEGHSLNIIKDSLPEIVMEKFLLKIKGVGFFPPGNSPKILWAGFKDMSELIKLRNKVENKLHSFGIQKSRGKYRPHITLVRLKRSNTGIISTFLSTYSVFETEKFFIDKFRLYSSKLYPSGAVHTVEGEYYLN